MRYVRPFFLTAALGLALSCGAFHSYAQAYNAEVAEAPPLVVIRFNQPHVYFDRQLYNAVSQAVAAKPDVMFDVVSNAPQTGNMNYDEQWIRTASRNTQAVVATLQKFGVPMERMRITGKTVANLRFDETAIYVR